jgi:hypothetical protein
VESNRISPMAGNCETWFYSVSAPRYHDGTCTLIRPLALPAISLSIHYSRFVFPVYLVLYPLCFVYFFVTCTCALQLVFGLLSLYVNKQELNYYYYYYYSSKLYISFLLPFHSFAVEITIVIGTFRTLCNGYHFSTH